MTKTPEQASFIASKKMLFLLLAVALIAVSAVLCLTKGLLFGTEFGGGSALTVQFTKVPTQEQVDTAVKTVKANTSATVLSAQKYGEDDLLIRTTPMEDTEKVEKAVAAALNMNENLVNAESTPRSVNKDALISLGTSLLLAAGIALVYFALRFGILPAVATLFGFVVMIGIWLIPYTLCSVFDYKAFTVLAVGVALFTLESAVVYAKKIERAADLNPAPALKPVLLLTVALVLASLVLGIAANLWVIAIPMIVIALGAAFTSLLAATSLVLTFKK